MYTGIVQAKAEVLTVARYASFRRIVIAACQESATVFDDVSIGASVSIDGVCLTVIARDAVRVGAAPDAEGQATQKVAYFEIGERTAELTTLEHISVGDIVHVERSYRSGEENGGHALYGHVDSTARLVARCILGQKQNEGLTPITADETVIPSATTSATTHMPGGVNVMPLIASPAALSLTFEVDPSVTDFLIEKGFVGVHGASLTIDEVDRDANTFTVNLIPETLRRTTLGPCAIGDSVNIEIDQMTRTIVSTIQRAMVSSSAITP